MYSYCGVGNDVGGIIPTRFGFGFMYEENSVQNTNSACLVEMVNMFLLK